MNDFEIYDQNEFQIKHPQIWEKVKPEVPEHYEFVQAISEYGFIEILYTDPECEDISLFIEMNADSLEIYSSEISRD